MRHIRLIGLVFIISSCTTGYDSAGWMGGYSDTQINETTWKVSVSGNAYTSQMRIRDYAMLRASELTLEKGYKYFVVLSDDNAVWQKQVTTNGTANTTGSYDNFGRYKSTTSYNPPQTTTQTRFGNELFYAMSNREVDGYLNYDAQMIYDSLSATYK